MKSNLRQKTPAGIHDLSSLLFKQILLFLPPLPEAVVNDIREVVQWESQENDGVDNDR